MLPPTILTEAVAQVGAIMILSKPENRKDYAKRMQEFFDHHLQGKAAPAWLKDGVPHLKMDDHLKARNP